MMTERWRTSSSAARCCRSTPGRWREPTASRCARWPPRSSRRPRRRRSPPTPTPTGAGRRSPSGTALSALAGDLRFVARLRGLRGLVHLPNQHLARYGLLLHEPYVVTVHDLIRYLDLLDGGGLIAALGRRDAWYLRRDYA